MSSRSRFERCHAAWMGLLLLVTSMSTHAFSVDSTSVGSESTITWSLLGGIADSNNNINDTGYDLTGSAIFKLTGFDAAEDTITFEITLSNTTDAANTVNAGLRKLGFTATPTISGSDSSATGNGGPDPVDFLVVPSGPAGPDRWVAGEEVDLIEVVLDVPGLEDDGVEFSPFKVKYRTDEDGSFWLPASGEQNSNPIASASSVPTPGTLALLCLGALLGRKRFLKLD